MKYIQARFILCTMLATSSVFASAQAADWNETDSLANKKDQMVYFLGSTKILTEGLTPLVNSSKAL